MDLTSLLPKGRPLTLNDIIAVSWYPALEAAKEGRPFVSKHLSHLVDMGRIKIRPLGPVVEINPNGLPFRFEVDELSFPAVWTKEDDLKQDTEVKKIDFVHMLFENCWNTMDDVFEQRLRNGSAIVSEQYRYSKSETFLNVNAEDAPNQYFFRVYTAAAFIPEGVEI